MTPESVKADYRRTLKDTGIVIRRYTGTGQNRPFFDVGVRARVTGYDEKELVGGIVQGDRKAIIYADDVVNGGLTLPITTNDKLRVRGKELGIIAADDSTRRIDGVLIAIEIQARG